MKTPVLAALFSLLFIVSYAQPGVIDWAQQFGGSGTGAGTALATDATGNVYQAGVFIETIDLDPGPGNVSFTSADQAILIRKLTTDGNLLWGKALIPEDWCNFSSMTIDNTGAVYLTGRFYGTLDVDPGAAVQNLVSDGGSTDGFVIKLDASGNFLWSAQIGGPGADDLRDITIAPNGQPVLTGVFKISADFDPGPGTVSMNAAGGSDLFVLKLHLDGSLNWVACIGGTGNDETASVTVDQQERITVTGSFSGTVDLDPSGDVAMVQSEGSEDVFVLQLSGLAEYRWSRTFGGSGSDEGYELLTDGNGSLYVSGNFSSPFMDFNPGGAPDVQPGIGTIDFFVMKLTDAGATEWVHTFGAAGAYVYCGELAVSPSGLFIGGTHTAAFDIDPGTNVLYPATADGMFTLLLDAHGDYLWQQSFASDVNQPLGDFFCRDIALDAAGSLFTTGAFNYTVDADPGPGTITFTASGFGDGYLLKQHFVLGTDEAANAVSVLYPNPFRETAVLVLREPVQSAGLEWIDISGQTVRAADNLSGTELSLDAIGLAPGTYLIRVTEGNAVIATERVVIRP